MNGSESSGNPVLGVVLAAVGLAVIIGIPVVLVLVVARRKRQLDEAVAATWSGVVTEVEIRALRVKRPMHSVELPYLEVSYRTDEGAQGSFFVGSADTAGALAQTRLLPLPPAGYFEEVNGWREGDHIAKAAGSYYPLKVT